MDTTSGKRTITASEFKAKCLQLMDDVADSGIEIVITKHGKPVSRLVPYREPSRAFYGADKGRIQILGDIVSPMPAQWFEDPDNDDKGLF